MKATTFVSWEDVPHLSQDQKDKILSGTPAHQREARMRGVPMLGEGAVYNVLPDDFVVTGFELPKHWPKAYGFDVGWRMNAAIFGAWDRENDCVYVYDELYRGKTEPAVVAEAIKARGPWIPGVIDPASAGTNATDGRKLSTVYRLLGLDLRDADNAVEAGIMNVWQRLTEGRLKVFKNCTNLLAEYQIYRRGKDGKVVKQHDHALDALRYLIMSGLNRAIIAPGSDPNSQWWNRQPAGSQVWCG